MDVSPAQQLQLAKSRFALQDYHGTIHLLEELISEGRAFADVYHLIGLSYELVDQPERALEAFDNALLVNPTYVEAHIHRGIVLAGLGREEDAESAFAAAKKVGGAERGGVSAHHAAKLANKHADLGEAYAEARDLARAIQQFERALELGPSFHDLRLRLGRLLLDAGRTLEAREELAVVAKERPDMVEGRAAYGLACYLCGDASTARSTWQDLAREYPEERRVKAYLSMLDRSAAGPPAS
ncbi:MAG: tetratricopeptide repeat protein [Gemmatimonadota bacterium]|nr:tetratricopeptide repeat protein [Gemmatimonadota bacterium]